MAALDLEAGQTFGPYLLEAEISHKGGMGRVFKARHLSSGRICAIKVIHSHLANLPQYRSRFAREGKILRSLHHPNIVPIFDRGEIDGTPFIDTEFAEDQDLSLLMKTELAPDTILAVLEQAAEGLEAAHDKGIIHRDIKPGNLLVGREEGRPKIMIADFGVAWGTEFATTHTPDGKAVGTPGFMAPECMKGQLADRRADIYSLGCCLDLMVGPRRSFSPIGEVIAKAASFDPDLRYPTAMDLYEAAAEALDGRLRPLEEAPAPAAGATATRMDTPVRGTATRPDRRAAVVDTALRNLGLDRLVLSSRLARGRYDQGLVTAVLTVADVGALRPHANPLASELAEAIGCDRIRLVLLPAGQAPSDVGRCYFSLILAGRVPPGDLDSLTARLDEDTLEIHASPRICRLCDQDFLVPLVAELEVKRVKLNPINTTPVRAR
jgi:serine/threonine-protein kinase